MNTWQLVLEMISWKSSEIILQNNLNIIKEFLLLMNTINSLNVMVLFQRNNEYFRK